MPTDLTPRMEMPIKTTQHTADSLIVEYDEDLDKLFFKLKGAKEEHECIIPLINEACPNIPASETAYTASMMLESISEWVELNHPAQLTKTN